MFKKLIKTTLKWEKESHAHLLKCSERIILIASSSVSFNINVLKSRILHQFILGKLFTEILCLTSLHAFYSSSTQRMNSQAGQL